MVCRLNDRLCALPIAHVVETMRPMAVRGVAECPSFVLGVSVIRGQAVPVIDAASLLGAPGSHPARIVTVAIDGRRIALAVEAVLGVMEIPLEFISGLPPLLRDAAGDVVSALGALDRELLYVLNSARIVPGPVWAALQSKPVPGDERAGNSQH